jgi:uncharacterized protein YoxC
VRRVGEDLGQKYGKLKETFVEIEAFNELRVEIDPLRRAAMANIDASVEERERVNQRLVALSNAIAKLAGEKQTEVLGAQLEHGFGGPEEVRKMKLAIEGIEGAVQREIRKLKRNVRKVERELEDREEKEARVLAALQNKESPPPSEAEPTTALAQEEVPMEQRTVAVASSGASVSREVALIQDDFQVFFVLMFSVLLYFLVADMFTG